MESLYFSINPNPTNLISGHLFQFLFVSAIGLLAWFGVYKLLSNPASRKAKFRNWRRFPQDRSFIYGGVLGILIMGFAYCDNWLYFFQIDLGKNELRLQYFFPERSVILSIDDIKNFYPKKVIRRNAQFRLVFETKDGEKYTSSVMDGSPLNAISNVWDKW